MSISLNASGLEFLPPTQDGALFSVCLPVGVFNPREVNATAIRYQVGFVCGDDFGVSAVQTEAACCKKYDQPLLAPVRQEDERMYYGVAGAFNLAPGKAERFFVTFCWKASAPKKELLAFTIRVQTAEGVSSRNLKFKL